MNAFPMEEEVHVHRYVPTQLDHSSAAVSLDILYLNMPAMVFINYAFCKLNIASFFYRHQ